MIKVLNSGLFSTIQDLGRIGFQEYGVPISGVMDSYSASLANLLLGNSENDAVMEITMQGPRLEFVDQISFVVSGAKMQPRLNDQLILLNSVCTAYKGDVLSFGSLDSGLRAYLAVGGGFKSEVIMGSRSMYPGVTAESCINKGDLLVVNKKPFLRNSKNASVKVKNNHLVTINIDVYQGPEFELLESKNQELLNSQQFSISPNHNRMGYQLVELVPNKISQILTSPVMPGTVQLTPSGRLIILMRDAQTTGGYPRILQLDEGAINCLSQKRSGDKIRFNLKKYPF